MEAEITKCSFPFVTVSFQRLLSLTMIITLATSNDERGMFGFDIHHRFSDKIMEYFPIDDLPEKDSVAYYTAMTHRDRVFRGRQLSGSDNYLTFLGGNQTLNLPFLSFLHYANVTVGSPGVSFLVALDTGSDLFWLPCDCISCTDTITLLDETITTLNIYYPNSSTTSRNITCGSRLCLEKYSCVSLNMACTYSVDYLSENTSSFGYLVEDYLQLTTDNTLKKRVAAKVPVGCGQIQTGVLMNGGVPNGLLGLGLAQESVPSTLAKQRLIADSFSLCFGTESSGRITFGDKGSINQSETSFNLLYQSYSITVTNITVGGVSSDFTFSPIFDTGSSFTYLSDPAYSAITKLYDGVVKHKHNRFTGDITELPFQYCYEKSPNQNASFPSLKLTMEGGADFDVPTPVEEVKIKFSSKTYFCLAIMKIYDIDIIGQNFMSGYRLVFDRERMILGFENVDCNTNNSRNTTIESPTKYITTEGRSYSSANCNSPRFVNTMYILMVSVFILIFS